MFNNPLSYTDPTGYCAASSLSTKQPGCDVQQQAEAAAVTNDKETKEAKGNEGAVASESNDNGGWFSSIVSSVSEVADSMVQFGKDHYTDTLNTLESKSKELVVAGTDLVTKDDYKASEDITVGDEVYELLLDTGDATPSRLTVSETHPFYVPARGWVASQSLNPGDVIETDTSSASVVISLNDMHRREATYNFTVDEFHSYYVSQDRVLVHNQDEIDCELTGAGEVTNMTAVGRWISPDEMAKMQKLERYKKAIRVRRTLLIQQMQKHL